MKYIALLTILIGLAAASDEEKKSVVDAAEEKKIDLTVDATKKFLESGVTHQQLAIRLESAHPIFRLGPGYTIYLLEDGTLRVPCSQHFVVDGKLTAWTLKRIDSQKKSVLVSGGDWEFSKQPRHRNLFRVINTLSPTAPTP